MSGGPPTRRVLDRPQSVEESTDPNGWQAGFRAGYAAAKRDAQVEFDWAMNDAKASADFWEQKYVELIDGRAASPTGYGEHVSEHKVEVIRIDSIEKHPNADSLGLVRIYGFTCCVRLGDVKVGDLCAYIEPDYVVPDTEQFAFLGSSKRIKARRFRGEWSQGLLIKAPAGAKVGQDVMAELGITRWVPPGEREQAGVTRIAKRRTRFQAFVHFFRKLFFLIRTACTVWRDMDKPPGREPVHESLREFRVYDLENYRLRNRCRNDSSYLARSQSVQAVSKSEIGASK